MTQTIPNDPDEPFFAIRVTLDGITYSLDFEYSTREDCYYLSIFDASKVAIVLGLKLVPEIPLLPYLRARAVPAGELVVQSLTGKRHTPRFGEIGPGRMFELTYFPAGT